MHDHDLQIQKKLKHRDPEEVETQTRDLKEEKESKKESK